MEKRGNISKLILLPLQAAWMVSGQTVDWQLHFTVPHDRISISRGNCFGAVFRTFLDLRDGQGGVFFLPQIAASNIVIFYVCRISLYNGELWTHLKKRGRIDTIPSLIDMPIDPGICFSLFTMKANLWTHKKRVTARLKVA